MPSNPIPFTAVLRVVPNRANGKRMEIWRDREKLAAKIHRDVLESDSINLALPGGGATEAQGAGRDGEALTNMVHAAGAVPQFGQDPDTVRLTGFYTVDFDSIPVSPPVTKPYPHPTVMLFHANSVVSGPGNANMGVRYGEGPTYNTMIIASDLKAELESLITDVDFTIIKLDVNGTRFGHGAANFPNV